MMHWQDIKCLPDAAWMFIKIGNKLNVFTQCVWVGLCVITGWTLGPAVCLFSTAWHCRRRRRHWQPRCGHDKMNFCNFRHFSSSVGGLCWLKTVWPAETHNLVLSTLGRFTTTNSGVNFEARKEPRSKARSQHLPNKFGLAKGERTSRLFMMVIGFMLPSFCNSDQSDGNTPHFPLFRLLLWECSKDSLCNKYWEVIHSWVMLSGIYKT